MTDMGCWHQTYGLIRDFTVEKVFQKRNPTLRVFGCYLHQDEATPHLHIDFIPYVTDWKGKRNGHQSFAETGIKKSWISRWK